MTVHTLPISDTFTRHYLMTFHSLIDDPFFWGRGDSLLTCHKVGDFCSETPQQNGLQPTPRGLG